MADITITDEQIKKAFTENMSKILEDVFTSYDSPIKKLFEQEDFKKELQTMAKNIFGQIIGSKEFQENLKKKLLEKAVENMMSR